MLFEYKTGDLMQAQEEALCHGCNIDGVMGAGVAALVRKQHPEAYYAYAAACDSGRFRPGSAQAVVVDSPSRWVYNLGTQDRPGPHARIWWVFLAFANMAEDAKIRGINQIAIPEIGCGIGGLSWPDVEVAIKAAVEASSHPDLEIVVYTLP